MKVLSLDVLKGEQARLETWRAGNPLRAALVFFAVYVTVTGLSLPGATILTLAAGALFGLAWGTLIVSFAASIGATIAFLLSRLVLRDWVASHFADRILGVTIVGEHAADLLAEFVLAMKHGIGLNKILATIHIYPTISEANKSAAGAWRLAHQPRRLLAFAARFHAWRRA